MSGLPDAGPAQRRAFLAAAALVLLGALLARLAGAAQAFAGGELVTLDGDSLYHLRRIRMVVDAFPHLPWVDPWIAWPDGGPIPWAIGFDLLGAALLELGRAAGGAAMGDLWVAALCPLLGVAVVAAAIDLAWALRPDAPHRRGVALAAGILAAVVPQGLDASRYGRIDHHVAEALAMVLLARWALRALPPFHEVGAGRRAGFELAGGALSGGAVLLFTGSPLYVALVVPVLLAGLLLRPRPTVLGSGGPGLLLGAALAAAGAGPAVAQRGLALAFGFPSWLQPLLLAVAGAALSLAAVVSGRAPPGPRRLAAVSAAGLALLGAAAVAAPQAAGQALAGLREWLLKADPWIERIDEFQPLLRDPGGPAGGVNRFLGALGFAAPLLLPLAALGARAAGRARAAAFLWVTAAILGLALLQARFSRVLAPFLAVTAALTLAWLAERLEGAGGRPAWRARLARALPVTAALAVALLDPRVRAAMGTALDPVPDAMIEGAFDLRRRPPGPAPGVLAPWDLGNQILVLAGRPVVATGFGPYPDQQAYWEGEKAMTVGEDELLPWLAGRRIGWVVAGAANLLGRVKAPGASSPFAGAGFDARWLQAVPSAPLLIGGSGVPGLGARHFGHLLPVFASTRTVLGLGSPLPVIWIFEVVAGARLAGRAAPGARVVLEIPLLEHGRRHTWRGWADAGPDGRWAMAVPVPTDLAGGTLASGQGLLRVPGAPARPLAVPEAAVRQGGAIEVDPRTTGAP